jgi:hypothetical protein
MIKLLETSPVGKLKLDEIIRKLQNSEKCYGIAVLFWTVFGFTLFCGNNGTNLDGYGA